MKKKKWMLYSLLCLTLTGPLVVSCGKDNDAGDAARGESSSTTVVGYNGTSTNGVPCAYAWSKDELRSHLASQALPQERYNREDYYVSSCTSNKGFLGITWTKCNGNNSSVRSSTKNQDAIQHEVSSSKASLYGLLVTKLDQAGYYDYLNMGGYLHQVRDPASGDIWEINTCLPIVAQPTRIYSSSGQSGVIGVMYY